jgi:hypothetical protein
MQGEIMPKVHRVAKVVTKHRQIFDTPLMKDCSTKGKCKVYGGQSFMDLSTINGNTSNRYSTPIPATRRV